MSDSETESELKVFSIWKAFQSVQELARNMENQEDIEMETPMEFEAPSQDIDPEAATQAFGDENQSQIDTEAPTQVPEVNDQHSVRS